IGAVVLLSLGAALQSYQAADAYARDYQDPYMINAQPERLREAVRYLPDKAVIGYLSDLPFDAVSGQSAHFGVMYALAPRLVTRSADSHEWVVGNFSHPLGYCGVRLWLPCDSGRSPWTPALHASLGIGLGIGIGFTSCLYFLLLVSSA